jgi:CRP-like cAMP-binding protein
VKCAASEVIAHEGAVADCLFVLVRGTAGVTKLVDGEAVPVHQYADGTLGRVQPPRSAPPLRARGGGHTQPSAHRPPDWRRTRHVSCWLAPPSWRELCDARWLHPPTSPTSPPSPPRARDGITRHTGEHFGELSMYSLLPSARRATVVATSECVLLRVPRDVFRATEEAKLLLMPQVSRFGHRRRRRRSGGGLALMPAAPGSAQVDSAKLCWCWCWCWCPARWSARFSASSVASYGLCARV